MASDRRCVVAFPPIVRSMAFALFLVAGLPMLSSTQTREQMKEEAESRLQKMTPEEIDAKIQEYGMTREEAEAKAKEIGIDLDSYLQARGAATPIRTPRMAKIPSAVAAEDTSQEPPIPQYEAPKSVSCPIGPGKLPYFGYDVFATPSTAFEPTAAGPVDPDYLIGTDDVLRLTVWGQVELQHELIVDHEGRIFIPTIGQFMVSGLTLQAATEKLKAQMSRSYSGLNSSRPTTWLDVSLARLRPKRIYMMGEVDRPGGYTISSYATVFSALYSIGGPTVKGSLRDVRVIRSGKTIAHVDLYDYLTGAEHTNDFRIQNNDIVFVPTRGRTVGIADEVRKPALYELKESENLRALLSFAGGVLPSAYLERVQVDGITPFMDRNDGSSERRVQDVDFREVVNGRRDYDLHDGDIVTVYSVFDIKKNVVQVTGAVKRPGPYDLGKAPTIRRLIALAQGVEPKAFLGDAQLFRLNSDEITRRIMPFDLGSLLADSTRDIALQSRDSVVVFSTEATEIKHKYVTIRGEVKTPGRYDLHDGMALRDLILAAGGFTDDAEILQAEVSRIKSSGLGGDTLAILLHPPIPAPFRVNARMLASNGGLFHDVPDLVLEHRDEVLIRSNPYYHSQQNVTVAGDVMYPGSYTIQDRTERMSSVVRRAGGLTSTSYLGGARLLRKGNRVAIDFAKALEGDTENDVVLQDSDEIIVPPRPRTVGVFGQVNRPGLFSFIEGDAVSDYVDRAGGVTDSASYAVLTKPTGESRKVKFGWLRRDPGVPEGSTIEVAKVEPEPEGKPVDLGGTIKDIFGIAASAVTIMFLIVQTRK